MTQVPRSTKRTIAEILPLIWTVGGLGLLFLIAKLIAPAPVWVAFTLMMAFLVILGATAVYHLFIRSDACKKQNNLRNEVLKRLACSSYDWSEPQISGIRDIYAVDLIERDDVNEYGLIIYSTHPWSIVGKKGVNLDLVHSVIDDIFGYKIEIKLKEPTLFKELDYNK